MNRKPTRAEMTFLLLFHATLSGGFLIAYLSGDEDTYRMHQFAGYTVLVALIVRLAVGLFAGEGSPLRLPRPRLAATGNYLRRLLRFERAAYTQRSPLLAWMAVVLLVGVGTAAAAGAGADFFDNLEDLHEALGEASLFIVFAHIALVFALHGMKRLAAAPGAPSTEIHTGARR